MKRSKTTFSVLLATVVLVCLFFGNLAAEKTVNLDQRSEEIPTSDDDFDFNDPYTPNDDDDLESDLDVDDEDDRHDDFDDEHEDDEEDWEHELEIESAELELIRNQVEQSIELASDEVSAAVYGIAMLLELAEPEVAKTELSQLFSSATNPTIKRAIQLGLMRVHAELDDSQSAIDIAKQLVATE